MKTHHQPARAILCTLLAAYLFGCGVQRISNTQTTYVETKRSAQDTTIVYAVPLIRPTATTRQTQDIGDVTISADIVPFTISRTETERRTISVADPSKPGYDVYEIAAVPKYAVTPEIVRFNLRIRDRNENANLVLEKIAFSLLIDGVEFSFPEGYRSKYWQEKSMIMAGTEETFVINGPAVNALNNPKLIRLRLTGVPVAFSKAGETTDIRTFEWFFECSTEQITKADKIAYRYETEPIYKEKCKACTGIGYHEKTESCHTCDGKGSYVGTDGKVYQCYTCKGAKTALYKYTCQSCSGKGMFSFPKSEKPPVASTETWTGWKVKVVTHPAGATVSTYNIITKQYVTVQQHSSSGESLVPAATPMLINWFSGKTGGSEQYPIRVELGGKTVQVLPYGKSGKPSPNIQIDFRGAEPIVKVGKEVKQ